MKRIATLAALAAAAALSGCSYSSESNILGYRSHIGWSTPGAGPPRSAPPQGYSATPTSPPPSAHYSPPASCYAPGHYNRWGYWVPGRYRC